MSDPRFFQAGFDKKLAHLVEECGELLAAAGKTQRWGPWSTNPLKRPGDENFEETNFEWLKREMKGVMEAIARLEATMRDSTAMSKVAK